jgi:hypothetical protein
VRATQEHATVQPSQCTCLSTWHSVKNMRFHTLKIKLSSRTVQRLEVSAVNSSLLLSLFLLPVKLCVTILALKCTRQHHMHRFADSREPHIYVMSVTALFITVPGNNDSKMTTI